METENIIPMVEPATIVAPSIPFTPHVTKDAAFIILYEKIRADLFDLHTVEYLHLLLQAHWFEGDYRLEMNLEGVSVARFTHPGTKYQRTWSEDPESVDARERLRVDTDISVRHDPAMKVTIDRMRWILHRMREINENSPTHIIDPRSRAWLYLHCSKAAYNQGAKAKPAAKTGIGRIQETLETLLRCIALDRWRVPMAPHDEDRLRLERLDNFAAASDKVMPFIRTPLQLTEEGYFKPKPGKPRKPTKAAKAAEAAKARRVAKAAAKAAKAAAKAAKAAAKAIEAGKQPPQPPLPSKQHEIVIPKLPRPPLDAEGREQWNSEYDAERIRRLQVRLHWLKTGMYNVHDKNGSKSEDHKLTQQQNSQTEKQPKSEKRSLRYGQTK